MSDDDGVMSQWCTVIQQRAGTLIFEEASERPVEGVVSDRTRVTRLEFSILYHSALMKSRNFNGYLVRLVLLEPMMKTRLFWRIQT